MNQSDFVRSPDIYDVAQAIAAAANPPRGEQQTQ